MEELGELIIDSLPDFFRPVKALIDNVANLFNTIKTNIWDFYKVSNKWLKIVYLHRGSYMSAHVLLNLLTSCRKEIKCEACRAFISFSQRV